jgi:group I intron endonuclease
LRDYFNLDYLELVVKRSKSLIYISLLKLGYSSFSLEILEYCSPEKCVEREQYYFDLLNPEYNILKTAGSSLGFKHSADSKIFLHLKRLNANLGYRAKRLEHLKRLHADTEYKAKRLKHLKRLHSSQEHKEQIKRLGENNKGRPRTEGSGKPSVPLEVVDLETGIKTIYPSISEAAGAIGITHSSISMVFKRKPGESTILMKKKRYQITKLS